MKRICHVITRMILGGAQENTHLSCAGLHRRGYDVTLITGPETGPEGSLLDAALLAGYHLEVFPTLRRAIHPVADLRALAHLTAYFERTKPDVVHTHSSKAGILGRIAARRARVPVIVHTIHGMSFNRTQPWAIRTLYRHLERYCADFTDHIATVADAMTNQALAAGLGPRDKFSTIYSGMETEWFAPDRHDRRAVRQSWGFDDGHIVAGTVARLFRNKGYEQLIPAMAEAADQCPDLRFVWIGDGAQRNEYETRLRGLGLHDRVHLTGLIPPSEVARMLAGVDFLVHTSQWEGLPRVAVQALLMERPVISFAIDGAPEVVIPDETGILVPLNHHAGLVEAMARLASETATRQRLGRAGRQRCLAQFDHEVMVEGLDQLYHRLTPRPRS